MKWKIASISWVRDVELQRLRLFEIGLSFKILPEPPLHVWKKFLCYSVG